MIKRYWVVVLGDFGRSPRMQYHARSLSQQPDVLVDVIAYAGAPPLLQLTASSNVTIHYVPPAPQWLSKLPRKVALILKAVQQILALLVWMLCVAPRPDVIIMQNPPALPTMLACWLVCKRYGSKFVIDWHNFSYSIMAMSMSSSNVLVRLLKKYEQYWCTSADAHFCVTKAMQHELSQSWTVNATVLYDRPTDMFKPTSQDAAQALFSQLSGSILGAPYSDFISAAADSVQSNNLLAWLRSQPTAIAISSTSWTADEDFSILLQAAKMYDTASQAVASTLPNLLIFVTGKGPQKDMYEQQLQQLSLKRVAFRLLWLALEDYPTLLGCADLGVCLHTSSSGLDLPMKVLDMYGSGLPVCAVSYSCIGELVADMQTGLLFSSPSELAENLIEVFRGFQSSTVLLDAMKEAVAEKQSLRWEANWSAVAWPVLKSI